MSAAPSVEPMGIRLLSLVTCPHCWERFPPEKILWISEHLELLGDPRLGPDHPRRFLPSRFTPEGDAIDAKGLVCRGLACPHCHLAVPRGMVELEPLFLSILGAPSSGKSFYLTAMTWELRKLLPLDFGIGFSDADPASNRALNECEEGLFLNPRASELIPLGDLIRKTELQGELYDTVSFGQHTVSYPRPFLFALRPQENHPNAAKADSLARMLCLYDNAGEHFQPGQDTATSPVTRHLARSKALLFLFDPTQDRRFRQAARRAAAGDPDDRADRLSRQETILNEAAARVRRHAGLAQGARVDSPLIVVVSKHDAWASLLGDDDPSPPWIPPRPGRLSGLAVERIERQSTELRSLLLLHCPEIVTAAEGFSASVTYVAVSSLGPCAERDPATGLLAVRPEAIAPRWASAPVLYALSKTLPGLIPRAVRRGAGQVAQGGPRRAG
jgi:hypothetical protein